MGEYRRAGGRLDRLLLEDSSNPGDSTPSQFAPSQRQQFVAQHPEATHHSSATHTRHGHLPEGGRCSHKAQLTAAQGGRKGGDVNVGTHSGTRRHSPTSPRQSQLLWQRPHSAELSTERLTREQGAAPQSALPSAQHKPSSVTCSILDVLLRNGAPPPVSQPAVLLHFFLTRRASALRRPWRSCQHCSSRSPSEMQQPCMALPPPTSRVR